MMIKAMEVSGIEGNFRTTCENVMRVLRAHKDRQAGSRGCRSEGGGLPQTMQDVCRTAVAPPPCSPHAPTCMMLMAATLLGGLCPAA